MKFYLKSFIYLKRKSISYERRELENIMYLLNRVKGNMLFVWPKNENVAWGRIVVLGSVKIHVNLEYNQ